jgi:hypothetical protein
MRPCTSILAPSAALLVALAFALPARAEDPNAPPAGGETATCNPPCGPGFVCNADGRCLEAQADQQYSVPIVEDTGSSQTTTTQPPGYGTQPSYGYAQPPPPATPLQAADEGWAFAAGIMGLIAAGSVFGLTVGAAVTNDGYDYDTSRILATSATLTTAVFGPIIAIGAGSARNHPAVTGSTALRVVGWILYGISIASALVALSIAIAAESEIDSGIIYAIGTASTLSLVSFSLDAFISAGQAAGVNEMQGAPAPQAGLRLSPFASLRPTQHGGTESVFGLAGAF